MGFANGHQVDFRGGSTGAAGGGCQLLAHALQIVLDTHRGQLYGEGTVLKWDGSGVASTWLVHPVSLGRCGGLGEQLCGPIRVEVAESLNRNKEFSRCLRRFRFTRLCRRSLAVAAFAGAGLAVAGAQTAMPAADGAQSTPSLNLQTAAVPTFSSSADALYSSSNAEGYDPAEAAQTQLASLEKTFTLPDANAMQYGQRRRYGSPALPRREYQCGWFGEV